MIEQIFGVLKQKFCILHLAPEYTLEVQACIPAALAAIHNFTHHHEPGEEEEDGEGEVDGDGNEPISGRVKNDNDEAEWAGINELDMRRDGIATAMWEQYVSKHIAWGLPAPGM